MMVAMMAVVFLATVGRYSQLYTIAWSEEFARYCMVGIVYLGLMLASRTDSHFVVEIIPLIFAKKPKIVKIFGLINAIIVDALTDNKNRTAANVRNAFTKGQGNIGTQGCVSYLFDQKGQIIIAKEDCDMDADDLMMMALDAGAEDFSEEEDSFEVITAPDDFSAVREALEAENIPMASAEVTMIPQTYVSLTDEKDITNIQRILDLLDEDDDVQEVYHNWEE
mgnify:CR=1 FL=1